MIKKVEGTKTTPRVDFINGYMLIEGRSIPFADPGFYNSLVKMVREYAANPASLTTIEINFECINAYSKRSLMQVFRILEEMYNNGNIVVINWVYNEEDETMLELGTIYSSLVKVPFNFLIK